TDPPTELAMVSDLIRGYPWRVGDGGVANWACPADRVREVGLRHSPLDAEHRGLGAKMVPFGGWEMPLAYPSGTLAEHRACRQDTVAFDVSHLGTVRVQGDKAFHHLQRMLTNDLRKIG